MKKYIYEHYKTGILVILCEYCTDKADKNKPSDYNVIAIYTGIDKCKDCKI